MINRAELARRVASRALLSRAQAWRALLAFEAEVEEALYEGEEVRLHGFGRFHVCGGRGGLARFGSGAKLEEMVRYGPAGKLGALIGEVREGDGSEEGDWARR